MQRLSRDQFEALVRDHHAAVHRSAARWVGGETATDVTQDVFVRVLEGKLRLSAAHSVRATLCWLATRLAANHKRSRLRRTHHEENAMQTDPTTRSEPTDPAQLAADADLHRSVVAAMESLPEALRLPLQLHCQDELTLAEVGAALRVPTSTAHDRVQQALQRLRQALTGHGFALALGRLPELVARVEPSSPLGLQQRLLALGETAAVGGTAFGARLALGAAAAVATVAVAVLAWWLPRADPAPARAGVAVIGAPAAGGLDADRTAADTDRVELRAPGAAPPRGEEPGRQGQGEVRVRTTSVFHGTVMDAGAWPVAGATVQAVAAGGLKPFELAHATIDAQGAFRLEVGPHTLYPDAVRLRVVETGRLLLETDELALPREADAAPLALVLPAAAGTALSRYELAVVVVGPDGLPLPGVPVAAMADATPAPRPEQGAIEASGTTGGDGIAVLRGRSLGAKRLFVDGRPAGLASQSVALELDRAGAHRCQVQLATGGRVAVHVGTVDGQPIEWANVWLEHPVDGWTYTGDLGADGRVEFTGLGGGDHTLHVDAGADLSPATRTGLRANGPAVDVRLKRRSDPRDVGDHLAELHGELVDAETGEVVEFGAFAIDVLPVRDGVSTLPSDRVLPRAPAQQLDGGGRFVAFHEVGLDAGRWALVAEVPGYAPAVVEFALRDGEMRTGLRVPLLRGGELRGRVLDDAGQPVAGARVFPLGTGELADRCLAGWRALSAGAADRSPDPSLVCAVAYTDETGGFELPRVPPGIELRLVAHQRAAGAGATAPLVVRAGELQTGLEIRLGRR
ncbi:MAG: sigma-70 family RNA polymerase sigma factor [Planctomycetes bacterium]|nr:sigma-70 family RNA polymerase sigma factor [Planctomycetota bacterium]